MNIIVNNILTNYQIFADGSEKESLIILPGWGKTLTEWIPTAKLLCNKYRVICLDLPGFGGTSKPKEDFDTYSYAGFVEQFLVKLKINKCSLLGHSFGGRLGIILAANTNMITNLILVDSAGVEKKSLVAKMKAVVSRALKPLTKNMPKSLRQRIVSVLGSSDYKSAGNLRTSFVKIVNQDLTHLLPEIKARTLVIWGNHDKQLSIKNTKVFKNLIPEVVVRVVWGAGHSPHLEKPRQFLEIINEYL